MISTRRRQRGSAGARPPPAPRRAFAVVLLPLVLAVAAHAEDVRPTQVDGDLFAAALAGDSTYVAVGDGGRIFVSRDRGVTFTRVESGTDLALMAVSFADSMRGWAAGQGGVVLQSADGGSSWAAQSSDVEADLLAVDFADAEHGLAAGSDATVIVTSDGGASWRRSDAAKSIGLEAELNLFAVRMLTRERAVAVGERGWILVTDDAGTSWTAAASPFHDVAMDEGPTLYALGAGRDGALPSPGEGALFVVGIDSTLGRSVDGVATWSPIALASNDAELFGVSLVGEHGLAVGSGGTVMRTRDAGTTWRPVTVPDVVTRTALTGVALRAVAPGRVHGLIVGQDGTVGLVDGDDIAWCARRPDLGKKRDGE